MASFKFSGPTPPKSTIELLSFGSKVIKKDSTSVPKETPNLTQTPTTTMIKQIIKKNNLKLPPFGISDQLLNYYSGKNLTKSIKLKTKTINQKLLSKPAFWTVPPPKKLNSNQTLNKKNLNQRKKYESMRLKILHQGNQILKTKRKCASVFLTTKKNSWCTSNLWKSIKTKQLTKFLCISWHKRYFYH